MELVFDSWYTRSDGTYGLLVRVDGLLDEFGDQECIITFYLQDLNYSEIQEFRRLHAPESEGASEYFDLFPVEILPGTYYLSADIDGLYDLGTIDFTIEEEDTLPALWSWSYSNGDASDEETQVAYDALRNLTLDGVYDFSHKVWNDIVNRVKAWVEFLHPYDADIRCADLDSALMTERKKTLTAEKYNAVSQCISDNIGDQYTSLVLSGEEVYASHITNLIEGMQSG